METRIFFKLSFEYDWLISQRGNDVLPVDRTIEMLKEQFDIDGLKSRIDGCEGVITLPADKTQDECMKLIYDIIKEEFNITPPKYSLVTNKAADRPDPETKNEAKTEEKPEANPEPAKGIKPDVPLAPKKSPAPAKESAYDSIEKLIGAAEFKALAKECRDFSQSFIDNDLLDVFRSRFYIFSVSDGYGMSTYLRLFAELLEETKLFKFAAGSMIPGLKSKKYEEVKLEAPNKENCFEKALELFAGNSSAKLVCIDISEWMQKLSSAEFRGFLRAIDNSENGHIVIFRVPFIEKNVLKDVEYVLNDILYVRTVSVPPFTGEELEECARRVLGEKQYTLDEGAWEVFRAMIAAEKSDGRFYGINTVHKVVNEILFTKLVSAQADGGKNITASDVRTLSDEALLSEINVTECLDELIGMDEVKERLKEIISQIEAAKANPALGKPSMHMRFLGNPGTGKTTIARILGQILKEKKILRNGGFIEVQGRDLCGRFIGETAPKTAGICREAYGSVLFIDEAYSLYREDSPKDYGKEAIETLLAEMENHRDDMVVIMAGYSDEMTTLMKANPGFESRMPYTIEFPNYKKEELAKIFMNLVKKTFTYDEEFEQCIDDYFSGLSDDVLNAKNFSNVRFVRNLFERTWGKAAMRCQMENTECKKLTVSDFTLASADKEFALKPQEKKRRLGF